MRDLKYLAAYSIPAVMAFSMWSGPHTYWATVIYGFVLLPLVEMMLPPSIDNFTEDEERRRLSNRFFDVLLYLNVPIIYGLLLWFLRLVVSTDMTSLQCLGLVLSMGIVLGVNGINVAHELGHRETRFEHALSVSLLLPSHYLQFFIEHNLGHHKYVATAQDPATARFNEPLIRFIPRAVYGVYTKAWAIESDILKKDGRRFWSVHNRMLWFTLLQVGYYALLWKLAGVHGMLLAIAAGVVGFILLESINYIEHYGLVRKTLPSGRPEPVSPQHSWNSDHQLGRIVLYELTRHSDHHYKATRPYQVLRHMDESPQLPYGYPTSIVMAWITPLWFRVMNKRVRQFVEQG